MAHHQRYRINELDIRRMQPPEAGNTIRYDRDLPGFGIRITAAGARSFILNYRCHGRERRLTIGSWPAWSATAARAKARELRRQIESGVDPLAQKEAHEKAFTVEALADAFIEKYAKQKKRSWRNDERTLRVNVLPILGGAKAETVHRRDIARMLDPIAARAPIMANRTLACVRRMFNWSVERGLLDTSPCTHLKPPGKEKSRDRVLTDAEIRTLWTRSDTARRTTVVLKLILATGQRPGEVRAMRWEEVDGAWWTIPSEKSKNGIMHRVPLTALALELLGSRGEGYVFRSRGKLGHISGASLNYAARNHGHRTQPWTPHDLRRTVGTRLGELGFNRLIQDKILGHKDLSVGAIYDRYAYAKEIRQALEAWERRLRMIILGVEEPGNVIEIRR